MWPSLASRLQRRHWARVLSRWAPERCTLETAAFIIGTDASRLGRALMSEPGRPVAPATLLSRDEMVAALRRRPAGT
jgi:hypothetical protein